MLLRDDKPQSFLFALGSRRPPEVASVSRVRGAGLASTSGPLPGLGAATTTTPSGEQANAPKARDYHWLSFAAPDLESKQRWLRALASAVRTSSRADTAPDRRAPAPHGVPGEEPVQRRSTRRPGAHRDERGLPSTARSNVGLEPRDRAQGSVVHLVLSFQGRRVLYVGPPFFSPGHLASAFSRRFGKAFREALRPHSEEGREEPGVRFMGLQFKVASLPADPGPVAVGASDGVALGTGTGETPAGMHHGPVHFTLGELTSGMVVEALVATDAAGGDRGKQL